MFHLLQAFIGLQTSRNAQKAIRLILNQQVAIDFSTDIIFLLTCYLLFLLIYYSYNLIQNIKQNETYSTGHLFNTKILPEYLTGSICSGGHLA